MKKYLVCFTMMTLGFVGCKKQHVETPASSQSTSGLRGRYVMYMKIDTFYNYSSATAYTLDVTHETLTGDTLYQKAGTSSQVIQPNPIVNYDPKIALADTLVFINDYSGTHNLTGGSSGFLYNISLQSYADIPIPGVSTHIKIVGANRVEVITDTIDPDGALSDSNGCYYKKL